MLILILLAAVSLALSMAITPVCRKLAVSWGIVDLPDNHRKVHKRPIPRVGGIPILLAYFGSCFVMTALPAYYGFAARLDFTAVRMITLAAVIVFFIGLADDIFSLKPWHKLAGEIVAAGLLVAGGVEIRNVSLFALHPWLGALCTIVWLVGCANAVNLIDGLDGLAGGVALLATITTIVAALLNGNSGLAIAALPLAGALLGFLFFNFNRASIFLGDSGSLLLGFLLGCYSILWSADSSTLLGMAAPLMALAVPLLDTSIAILRRFLRHRPIFAPDRSHIHHRLLALGQSPRRVALTLYMATGLAGAFSLLLVSAPGQWKGAILVLFACGVALGVQQLGYVEFDAARRLMLGGGFRRELNGQLAVQEIRQRLQAAATPYDCWTVIQRASEDLGFQQVRMRLAGNTFEHQYGDPTQLWEIRIPLSEEDWIELSYGSAPERHSTAIVLFADTIRTVLGDNNPQLSRSRTRLAAVS